MKMHSDVLLARCVRGGAVLALGSVFERGLRFVANMILARLLAPEQFGLMALVIASNGLFETLTEVGIRQSVIQNKKGDTDPFLSVAWWFNGARGCVLYAVGLIAAPYVAAFYDEPPLTALLRVAFLVLLFNGLTNPQLYVLEKKLRFSRYVCIVHGSALLGTLLCLGLACWIPNAWALVAGYVAEAAVRCAGSFLFCPFKVERRFDRDSWNELFRFSKGMAGLPILTFIFLQADIFFLGKMCGRELLGLYSMALTLATVPNMIFARVAGPMVLPVLSDMQDRVDKVRDGLLRMTRLLFLFGLPLATCLATFSGPILMLVYGARYARVAGAFGLLNFYVLLYMSGVLIFSTYLAVGRPEVHRQFTMARVFVLGIALYPAIRWFGPSGAAGARLLSMILAGIVQQFNLARLIDLPIRRYFSTATEGVILSMILMVPALGFRMWLEEPLHLVVVGAGLCALCWGYIVWTKRDSVRQLFLGRGPATILEG